MQENRPSSNIDSILSEVKLSIEDEKELATIKTSKGGLTQWQVQLALQSLFSSYKDVYIPGIEQLSEQLPLNQLKEKGIKYVAFSFALTEEHQVAIWIELNDQKHNVYVFDSLKDNETNLLHPVTIQSKKARAALEKMLGDGDNYQLNIGLSSYLPQTDEWSCGIHTIANIEDAFKRSQQQSLMESPIIQQAQLDSKALLIPYYLDFKKQSIEKEKNHVQESKNVEHKRLLLDLVEIERNKHHFYLDGPSVNEEETKSQSNVKDVFKPLADLLQFSVWGNLDRKPFSVDRNGNCVTDQKNRDLQGREDERISSLRETLKKYSTKRDTTGNSLLEFSISFQDDASFLKRAVPIFMEKQMKLSFYESDLANKENDLIKEKEATTRSLLKKSPHTTLLIDLLKASIEQALPDDPGEQKKFFREIQSMLLFSQSNPKKLLSEFLNMIGFQDFIKDIKINYPDANIELALFKLLKYTIHNYYEFDERIESKNRVESIEKAARDAALQVNIEQITQAFINANLPESIIKEQTYLIKALANNPLALNFTNKYVNSNFFLNCNEDTIIKTLQKISKLSEATSLFLALNLCPSDKLNYLSATIQRPIDFRQEKLGRWLESIMIADSKELLQFLIAENVIDVSYKHNGKSLAQMAAESGSKNVMEMLLDLKADVNEQNKDGETLLALAAWYQHIDMVNLLITHEADINKSDKQNGTPLSLAAARGDVAIMERLIEEKANINGTPALVCAVYNGKIDALMLLLKHPVDVNFLVKDKATPLLVALERGYFDIANVLIEHKADVNVTDSNGNTVLSYAAVSGRPDLIKNLLLKSNKVPDEDEKELLVNAVLEQDSPELLKILLDKKYIDMFYQMDAASLAQLAVKSGSKNILKMLLKLKIDVNEKNINGESLLGMAAWFQHLDIVNLLITHKADIDSRDKSGGTPLCLASMKGNVAIMKRLIEEKADVNQNGPLLPAVNSGQLEAVKLLLAHQAEVNIVTKTKYTPLLLALEKRSIAIADALIEKGADVNVKDINNNSPLRIAFQIGNFDIIIKLLAHHALLDDKDKKGDKLLALALEKNYIEVVAIALKMGAGLTLDVFSIHSLNETLRNAVMNNASIHPILDILVCMKEPYIDLFMFSDQSIKQRLIDAFMNQLKSMPFEASKLSYDEFLSGGNTLGQLFSNKKTYSLFGNVQPMLEEFKKEMTSWFETVEAKTPKLGQQKG